MIYQKNVRDGEKQIPPKDPNVKQGDTKPVEKPNALHSEYMNIFRSGY